MQSSICLASDAGVHYGALVSTTRDGAVLSLQAVVAQVESAPREDVALAFLLRVAALPWTGSIPDVARLWVTNQLALGGETEIGDARLQIGTDWPPATRGLHVEQVSR